MPCGKWLTEGEIDRSHGMPIEEAGGRSVVIKEDVLRRKEYVFACVSTSRCVLRCD